MGDRQCPSRLCPWQDDLCPLLKASSYLDIILFGLVHLAGIVLIPFETSLSVYFSLSKCAFREFPVMCLFCVVVFVLLAR